MIFIESRYGVIFGSDSPQWIILVGLQRVRHVADRGLLPRLVLLLLHHEGEVGLGRVGNLQYLNSIIGKKRFSSVGLSTGPTGRLACPMSSAIAFSFGSWEFLAA